MKPILSALTLVTGIAVAYVAHATVRAIQRINKETIYSQMELVSMFGKRVEDQELPEDEEGTRIVIAEGRAYWIEDAAIMTAPVDAEDNIDFDLAAEYNAIDAPRSELTKIMFILDNLKEDT